MRAVPSLPADRPEGSLAGTRIVSPEPRGVGVTESPRNLKVSVFAANEIEFLNRFVLVALPKIRVHVQQCYLPACD
jgi:hypothetical protein